MTRQRTVGPKPDAATRRSPILVGAGNRHAAAMTASTGYAALRRGRHSASGGIYLLTTVTHDRAPLFADWRCAQAACTRLAAHATWDGACLLCWVLMPDHWHGLLQLAGNTPLDTVMQHAKGRIARAVNQARGRGGAVWMPGFHDRALRREDDVRRMARYIVANPLRAGLVSHVALYPYWDAVWLSSERRD
jgi:putative transposase